MNDNDRRDRGGRVAARDQASHIVVMLTLTAMLGVVGFLVAGSIARSATQANGTHEIDFNEAEALGWEIAPRFEARKGDQVLRGTAAELSARMGEHEEREALHAEQLAHTREQHYASNISRLIRRIYGFEREHQRAWDKYLDEAQHRHTCVQSLDSATAMRKRETETFEELLRQPKEALLEHNLFLELAALKLTGN